MAGRIYIKDTTILDLRNGLLEIIYRTLVELVIQNRLSLNESLINLIAEMDQDTHYGVNLDVTKYVKNCEDFKILISLLDCTFERMDEQKKTFTGLDEKLQSFRNSIEKYSKDIICRAS